jgi:hypothetical protein
MMKLISSYHHNVPSIIVAITRTLGTSVWPVTQQLVVAKFLSSLKNIHTAVSPSSVMAGEHAYPRLGTNKLVEWHYVPRGYD